MTKTCIVLYIYDLLKKNGKFKLEDIEEKFNCLKNILDFYMRAMYNYIDIS